MVLTGGSWRVEGYGGLSRPSSSGRASRRRRLEGAKCLAHVRPRGHQGGLRPRQRLGRPRHLVLSGARGARLSLSEWWSVGLRTEDRRQDAKNSRETPAADASDSDPGKDKTVSLLEFVGIMFELLRPYKKTFAFGLVTLFLAAGAELMLPHYTAKTIFSIQKGNTGNFLHTFSCDQRQGETICR